jgi:hypothetical protein
MQNHNIMILLAIRYTNIYPKCVTRQTDTPLIKHSAAYSHFVRYQ